MRNTLKFLIFFDTEKHADFHNLNNRQTIIKLVNS